MPEVSARFKILPFAPIGGWDCLAYIATKRLATRVVGRALLAAIEFGNGRVKSVIERANVVPIQVGGGFENFPVHLRNQY